MCICTSIILSRWNTIFALSTNIYPSSNPIHNNGGRGGGAPLPILPYKLVRELEYHLLIYLHGWVKCRRRADLTPEIPPPPAPPTCKSGGSPSPTSQNKMHWSLLISFVVIFLWSHVMYSKIACEEVYFFSRIDLSLMHWRPLPSSDPRGIQDMWTITNYHSYSIKSRYVYCILMRSPAP